jgi:spore coat protein U-like protein
MKKILLAVATSAAVFAAGTAHAVSPQTATFTVTATLTPECTIATTGSLAFGPYTAFGGALTATGANVALTCTRGLTGLGSTNAVLTGPGGFVGSTTSPIPSSGAGPAGAGVIEGLQYTITSAMSQVPGVAPTAAALTTITSGDATTFAFSGGIAAGQAGAVPAGPGSQTLTLTVNY